MHDTAFPCKVMGNAVIVVCEGSVSYTHLDVYKRQVELNGSNALTSTKGSIAAYWFSGGSIVVITLTPVLTLENIFSDLIVLFLS